MPNNFRVKTSGSIGTSEDTIYTCPSSTQTTVIGLNLANILTPLLIMPANLFKILELGSCSTSAGISIDFSSCYFNK